MRFDTLSEWLTWQETLHPSAIELGLERLGLVLGRLGLAQAPFPVVTVAGTNGKGSSVAMLEAMLRAGGYRVGAYTSPHLLRYNERIRIDGREADDAALCAAFERIDLARGEVSLTYFEFGTLAAFLLFAEAGLDVVVLEVGMGGRLDAVNAWDPDVALVTAIDIDHADWLGEDREAIGREKAGIFRSGHPAVVSDPNPPASVAEHARAVGAELYLLGDRYGYVDREDDWEWWGPGGARALPLPALRGAFQRQNAAGAVMALVALSAHLPLSPDAMATGLRGASVRGRFELHPGAVTEIYDVAHNPQAAGVLADNLRLQPRNGRTLAVFAALADKDLGGILKPLAGCFDGWFVAGLSCLRGGAPDTAAAAVSAAGSAPVATFATVAEALAAARAAAQPGDRIVVFGSFYTVADALATSV